ncbi:MAG: helix-turn-helix domain-containing protein [Metallibacterium scheffleri]|jgi:predicted XRE-type DNA-binding protein|uniref:helix-turn-helix domain-containing protein n=1 Tax=Metallibacterium scheffleri TaxID=993689 RepID=UPI0026F33D91|nr:helix-turn-helix transcriptional regulator [Metallibacterium scheffleri]MCK9367505.1 helix-turn-helix domain-containing protein [Metallibacterium scheffleri]
MNKRNIHVGSDFDDFLADEGLLEGASAVAIKRVIAWQIAEAMKARGLSKKAMAEQMHTSRSHLDRLLDADDTGLTLETLSRAARVLGRRLRVELAA